MFVPFPGVTTATIAFLSDLPTVLLLTWLVQLSIRDSGVPQSTPPRGLCPFLQKQVQIHPVLSELAAGASRKSWMISWVETVRKGKMAKSLTESLKTEEKENMRDPLSDPLPVCAPVSTALDPFKSAKG